MTTHEIADALALLAAPEDVLAEMTPEELQKAEAAIWAVRAEARRQQEAITAEYFRRRRISGA